MDKEKSRLMTSGPIWKHLLVFSIPLIVGDLFQQMYNTVDALVIGNLIGDHALAAVGAGSVVISLMLSLFTGLGTGSGVVIAQMFGAGDDTGVRRAVGTTAAFTLASGILMTGVWIWLSAPMLRLLGTPQEIMDDAVLYLRIIFSSIVPGLIFNMGSGILRAVGDARTPLMYLIIAAVVNTALDILFVAQFGMGVDGVAIATLIAQSCAACLVVRKLMTTRGPWRVKMSRVRIEGRALLRIMRVGVPAGVQSMLMGISNLVVQSFINALGTSVIAAWNVFGKIDSIIFLPQLSFGLAVMTFTGQNFGAGRLDRVRSGMNTGLALSVGVCVALSAFIWAFSMPLLGFFTRDAVILETGHVIMTWMVPTYFMCAIMYIMSGLINGLGASFAAMMIMLFNLCALRVIMLYTLSSRWSGIELMLSIYPVSWAACSVGLMLYYKKEKWAAALRESDTISEVPDAPDRAKYN